MPHVIVKMQPGRSEAQKQRLTEAIVREVMTHLNCADESVSVSIEDVPGAQWAEQVYRPDIVNGKARLYKKPGYSM